jgi:hypothetical protein
MSTANTTANSNAAGIDGTRTPPRMKERALQKMAAENEAKRVENVAIQRRKLEAATMKAKEELTAKGKDAILKDKSSRPSRRPARKNRKPLPPRTNPTHDAEVTMKQTKASVEEKRLTPLRVVRPSYDYGNIVEQRVVDGVVHRIAHTDVSVHESLSVHDQGDGTEQRLANSVTDHIAQLADTPETAPSVVDTDSNFNTEPSTDSDEDAPQIIREVDGSPELVKSTISEKSPCSPLAILSMPNAALYPSPLSRDNEAALITMHVGPVKLPVTEAKPQKLTKAEKKAAKASEAPKEVFTVEPEGIKGFPIVEPIVAVDEPAYLQTFLAKPNGSGMTKKCRDLHKKLVALHVVPLTLPTTAPSELASLHRQQKKAGKAKKSVETTITQPVAVDASITDKETIVADVTIAPIEEPKTDGSLHEEMSVVVRTPIAEISEPVPSTTTEAEDKLQQVNTQAEQPTAAQTVIRPDDGAIDTLLTSDRNESSSESDTLRSSKTSRRSSAHSEASIRRKAEEARTTLLGNVSLETFVNTLEFELWDGTTTKEDICDAFASLAGRPTTDLNAAKVQRKIKMGSTSLYAFLGQLDFDDEVTVVGDVMKVFREAARNNTASPKLEVALWLDETSEAEGSRRGRRSKRSTLASGP